MGQVQSEKLKEAEEKAKTTIQAIQQEIDESAKKFMWVVDLVMVGFFLTS
jgi:hypothetical protein